MLYSVLFRFGHIRRSDQCAVYILYSLLVNTDWCIPNSVMSLSELSALLTREREYIRLRKLVEFSAPLVTDNYENICRLRRILDFYVEKTLGRV